MVGTQVAINIAAPSLKLGFLAATFDALFLSPGAAFTEPADYFVADLNYAAGDNPVPEVLARYRALLTVVAALKHAASYVVELQRELVFIGNENVVVPIRSEEHTSALQSLMRISYAFFF